MKVLPLLAVLALAVGLGVISADFFSAERVHEDITDTSPQVFKGSNHGADAEGKRLIEVNDGLARGLTRTKGSSRAAAAPASTQPQDVTEENPEPAKRLRKEIQNADSLPAEQHFLNGSRRLSLPSAQQAIGTEQFSASIESLQQQAFENPAAHDLLNIYGDYLSQQLEGKGGHFSLDAFACGLRICMGQARQVSEEGSWNTSGLYSFGQEGPPMYASIYDSFESDSGQTLYQFLFTTDPNSTGIALPRP